MASAPLPPRPGPPAPPRPPGSVGSTTDPFANIPLNWVVSTELRTNPNQPWFLVPRASDGQDALVHLRYARDFFELGHEVLDPWTRRRIDVGAVPAPTYATVQPFQQQTAEVDENAAAHLREEARRTVTAGMENGGHGSGGSSPASTAGKSCARRTDGELGPRFQPAPATPPVRRAVPPTSDTSASGVSGQALSSAARGSAGPTTPRRTSGPSTSASPSAQSTQPRWRAASSTGARAGPSTPARQRRRGTTEPEESGEQSSSPRPGTS
ncbi:hypothetical protein K432DRAFT_227507 [Lepidopterella palustris CBS 459.81]|uniref:Uncharacterized protein n=1 Tax=Lepidopterella palustris CBS 459.81 TaxID=1314670 RepID=A0A8E2JKX1_9PEZI|nr:hypothetical protein K432DRAFT_227507 [Lepidopterella palustris CBS 459.81]